MATSAAMAGQEAARYTRVAVWLHWVMAALLIANLFVGLYHDSFGKAATPWLMWFHKATGLLVLALTVARLGWRLSHRPPGMDAALKRWEAGLAHFIHWTFYAMLIAIPLTGWLVASTGGRPVTSFFSLFDIGPLPVVRSEEAHELWEEVHEILGKVMIGLILLHVAGALKHHFEGHRHLMGRMAPWFYRQR